MTSYSLNGYGIALKLRSNGTILVEGRDDMEALQKVQSSINFGFQGKHVIDTPDIVSDAVLEGLGNKVKVDAIHDYVVSLQGRGPNKLRVLVDREWDGLLNDSGEPLEWSPPVQGPSRFVTLGHSLENYAFDEHFVLSYIHHFGCGRQAHKLLDEVKKHIKGIFFLAASFSEVARRNSIIKK